jgi:hypothetical protein
LDAEGGLAGAAAGHQGIERVFTGVKGIAVFAVGVGGADVAALVFHDHAVVGFDVGIGREGDFVFIDGGGIEVALIGFVVGGFLVARGLDAGAGDDEFDGDEGLEIVFGFLGGEAFVGGVDAEAPGGAARGARANGFDDGFEALDHDLALFGFEDDNQAGEVFAANFFEDGDGAGVGGFAGGGGDVEADADAAVL